MIVTVAVLSVVFGLIMIGLSVRANARFRREKTLPMQWLIARSTPLSETVTRTAPRVVALSLFPVLAISVLILITIGVVTLTPRPGQEWMVLPVVIFMGSIFVAAHLFYLWLVERTLRDKAS